MTGEMPEGLSAAVIRNFLARGIEPLVPFNDSCPGVAPDDRHTPLKSYEEFIHKICTAIESGIDRWMKTASIVSVAFAGNVGMVLPEAIEGPELASLILENAPCATPLEADCSRAVARGLSEKWAAWHQTLTGILIYPAFGPPGPNIPVPLITFSSAGESELAPGALSRAMLCQFGNPDRKQSRILFDSLAESFYSHFHLLKANTLVTGVIRAQAKPRTATHSAREPIAMVTIEAGAVEPVCGAVVIPTQGNFT